MNNKNFIDHNEFNELLKNKKISDYDPIEEAFKILDVKGDGMVDINVFINWYN